MIEIQTLMSVETAELGGDAEALFSCLAARPAAVRAKAVETLLRMRAPGQRTRGGLARDFGYDPDAVIKPLFVELAGVIGWQPSPAWSKFLASLTIGLDEWRDGIGYDVASFAAMHPEERGMIRQWLRTRLTDVGHMIEWRELEAANALGDSEVLRSLADHHARDVRLRVQSLLGNSADIEAELCGVLREANDRGEIVRAEMLIPSHPTAAVKAALLDRLAKNDSYFVTLAMTMLEVFEGADGWAERPLLFRIQEQGAEGPLMQQFLERVRRKRTPHKDKGRETKHAR